MKSGPQDGSRRPPNLNQRPIEPQNPQQNNNNNPQDFNNQAMLAQAAAMGVAIQDLANQNPVQQNAQQQNNNQAPVVPAQIPQNAHPQFNQAHLILAAELGIPPEHLAQPNPPQNVVVAPNHNPINQGQQGGNQH